MPLDQLSIVDARADQHVCNCLLVHKLLDYGQVNDCIRNNGILSAVIKRMRAADGKQEFNLEWPNPCPYRNWSQFYHIHDSSEKATLTLK